jgi:hypothetical protein
MLNPDPLAHIRTLAERDPLTWGPALADHERQLSVVAESATTAKQLPPLWRQALTFARALARHLRAGLPRAHQTLASQRLAICRACPQYVPDSERCGACGCHLRTKVAWELSRCPEQRW